MGERRGDIFGKHGKMQIYNRIEKSEGLCGQKAWGRDIWKSVLKGIKKG